MDFGNILSRAWQIIWKNKVLWLFGILASCGSASSVSNNSGVTYETEMPPRIERFFNQMSEPQIALLITVVILVTLIIAVVVIFLSTIGRIGLIRGTQQADRGASRLDFGELFSGSMPYFWRVFLLNLLVGLAIALVSIAVIVFVVLGSIFTLGIGLICLVPVLCLLAPLGIVVSVVTEQASIAIVLENLGIMEGLQRGWEVVKRNAGNYIVIWLILLVIGMLVGFIIALPLWGVAAPALIPLVFGETPANTSLLLTGLCLVGYLPVLILLNGILNSYTTSAWTLTFMRLTGKSPQEEVVVA